MPKILISYRRADTGGIAGRVFDRLVAHYGVDNVFMDIDNIPLGVDFREHVANVFGEGDILIALVGPNWAGQGTDGIRRIDQPNDMVRIEVESALKRNIPVIPVLVDRTPMPDPGALPPSLESFAYRNGPPLDTLRDFHPHMDRLIRDMDRLLTRPTAPAPAADRPAPEAAPSTKPANPVPKPAASDPPPVQAAGSGAAGIAAPLVAPSPLPAGQAIRRDPPAAKPATAGAPAPVEPFRWLLLLSLALIALGSLFYLASILVGVGLGTTFLLTGYYLNMVPWVPISAVLFVLWQWPAVSAAARGPGQGLGRVIAAPFTGMAAARRAGATAAPGSRAMVIAFACLGISGLLYWIFYLGIGNAVIGLLRMSLRLIGAVMLGRMILKLRPASRPAR